jgi:hypothetical protein
MTECGGQGRPKRSAKSPTTPKSTTPKRSRKSQAKTAIPTESNMTTASGSFNYPDPGTIVSSSCVGIDPNQNDVTIDNTITNPVPVTITGGSITCNNSVVGIDPSKNTVQLTADQITMLVNALNGTGGGGGGCGGGGTTKPTPQTIREIAVVAPLGVNVNNPTGMVAFPQKCLVATIFNWSPCLIKVTLADGGTLMVPPSGSYTLENLDAQSFGEDYNYLPLVAGNTAIAGVGNTGGAFNNNPPQVIFNFRVLV